ncbi:CinA family protein [Mucilaginibacter pocheonensis]|uniref:Nicotinamide-nucleotide amidase n=1 Tax=Mucilaginibacter pocheonensis TaxID=398050 RepID=A0ABU1TCS8_9SPHI|nr:CinA family protein [Mucilaginibacter pocheonensis]MDR6943195.1 nicotinamide-nucleotide amidase [Mucilaginibacter pocheonensis]
MPSDLLIACHQLLKEKKLTIAFAESATAGRLSAELSLIPECGDILKGGIVCYDACIKQDILGVPQEIVEEYTPESAEVTKELAERLSHFMKADIQVAVTGLTMPGGSETKEKPVGTIFIHLLIKNKAIAVRDVFSGTAEEIVLQTVDRVASLLIDELKL